MKGDIDGKGNPEQPEEGGRAGPQPGAANTGGKADPPDDIAGAKPKPSLLASYAFSSEGLPVEVRIFRTNAFVPRYEITIPGIAEGTKLILETKLKGELVTEVKLDISEILDPKKYDSVKAKFLEAANKILQRNFPSLPEDKKGVLAVYLLQKTLGLGELEALLADEQLEEVVVNNSKEPVWVYHKKFGWCRTNLSMKSEEMVSDYASMIARKVGRQINTLTPTLDAHLPTGDRVNATLFPISSFGNTITIRKFSRNPWTITSFMKSKTVSSDVAALIWLCIQNELSLLVAGGTGSGKTSFLNAMAGLIPANQRIITIEDTRELTLPTFLHWVPMTVREANPEGKGEVTMLDLMVNALRQRPDRIIVGEIRRQREAEVMFEAMHTGHSVYATLHADNAEQTISRLTNPPLNIPPQMLDVLSGIVVTFRHRRFNIRRVLEFAEITKEGKANTCYRWDLKSDKMRGVGKMTTLVDTLSLYSGMDEKEINQDIDEKMEILDWMVKKNYDGVDQAGEIVSNYYMNPEEVLDAVRKGEELGFQIQEPIRCNTMVNEAFEAAIDDARKLEKKAVEYSPYTGEVSMERSLDLEPKEYLDFNYTDMINLYERTQKIIHTTGLLGNMAAGAPSGAAGAAAQAPEEALPAPTPEATIASEEIADKLQKMTSETLKNAEEVGKEPIVMEKEAAPVQPEPEAPPQGLSIEFETKSVGETTKPPSAPSNEIEIERPSPEKSEEIEIEQEREKPPVNAEEGIEIEKPAAPAPPQPAPPRAEPAERSPPRRQR